MYVGINSVVPFRPVSFGCFSAFLCLILPAKIEMANNTHGHGSYTKNI